MSDQHDSGWGGCLIWFLATAIFVLLALIGMVLLMIRLLGKKWNEL